MSWVTQPEGRSGVMGIAGGNSGIPTIEEIVARYCAATGRDGVPQLDWYFAYNLFRLTGIVQGIKRRVIDGTAASAQAARMAERVPMLAKAAWDFAVRGGRVKTMRFQDKSIIVTRRGIGHRPRDGPPVRRRRRASHLRRPCRSSG